MMTQSSRRGAYAAVTALIVLLGLGSRTYTDVLPEFVSRYAGDTLWAAMVYIATGVVVPTMHRGARTMGSLVFAFSIEFSQLYQAPWIEQIRATRLGALVLGFGFLWSDLVCYTIGIALAFGCESFLHAVTKRKGD